MKLIRLWRVGPKDIFEIASNKMVTHKRSKGYEMLTSHIPRNNKIFWKKKAKANICMAKELADIFGGAKADYLKKLNHRLRKKIADNGGFYSSGFAKAA